MFELISEEEQQLEGNSNNNNKNSLFPEFDLCSSIDESLIALDSFDSIFSESFDFVGIDDFFSMDSDYASVKPGLHDPIVVEERNGVQDHIGNDSCGKILNSSETVKEGMEDLSAAFVADQGDVPMVVGVHGSNLVLDGDGSVVRVGIEESGELGSMKPCAVYSTQEMPIEKDLQKVSLVEVEPDLQVVDVNDSKVGDEERKELESDSSDEAESSSSSSSSEESSSDEDDSEDVANNEDDRKNNKNTIIKENMKANVDNPGQVEEGEIRDDDDVSLKNMVDSSEDDFIAADDDDDDVVKSGPIRSKNELKSLPPVPRVDVTLQPSHQTIPVGVVLSVLGTQVIVEGVETHNPLNEGSILWITEQRIPLGHVDEIFGPVKNPYYIVRYNSENEVSDLIHEGTLISFVPEFANHILNDKSVYQKGYDASGDNDEEVDEAEFSDDEKEAEYRRMLKNSKRGANDKKPGNKKNKMKTNMNQPSSTPKIGNVTQSAPNAGSGSAQTLNRGQPGFAPQFPQPNGLVANGMQGQPQPNTMFSNGFPAQNMQWPQQNLVQFPYQMPLMNGMPFQQTGFLPNTFLQGGQPNFMAGQAFPPWPGVMGQNNINSATFGMGLQGQQAQPYQNGGQWVPFQNSGGQAIQFQNMGGLVGPYQNTGGQGVPSQNWRPSQNMGGQLPQNMGGQPPQNMGIQSPQSIGGQPPQSMGMQSPQSIGGQQPQNTGHGVVSMNTRGQGPPPQNAVGLGVSPKDTVSHEVSSQEVTGYPATGSEDQNHDAPPGFPGQIEYRPNFNSNGRGRGRQPYRGGRGRGRFSRGRNPRN